MPACMAGPDMLDAITGGRDDTPADACCTLIRSAMVQTARMSVRVISRYLQNTAHRVMDADERWSKLTTDEYTWSLSPQRPASVLCLVTWHLQSLVKHFGTFRNTVPCFGSATGLRRIGIRRQKRTRGMYFPSVFVSPEDRDRQERGASIFGRRLPAS